VLKILRFLPNTQNVTKFGIFNNHSNVTYLNIQEQWRSFFPQGKFHAAMWPVSQMCKTWTSEPRMKPQCVLPGVLWPQNSLVAERSWRNNHTTISSCCQPVSELRAVTYPAQKARSAGCFMLVPDWVLWHQTKKKKFLIKHNFHKSFYRSFISIIIIHQLIKSISMYFVNVATKCSFI
jgi:hypothetical protein